LKQEPSQAAQELEADKTLPSVVAKPETQVVPHVLGAVAAPNHFVVPSQVLHWLGSPDLAHVVQVASQQVEGAVPTITLFPRQLKH
jgi:hypothetical protein